MIYLFLAVLLLSLISVFSAAASRKTNPILIAAITNTFSVLLPLLIILPIIAKKGVETYKSSIIFAVLAGLCVGIFAMVINKSYVVNKVGIVTPVIFGGTILISTIMSYFLFKETLNTIELTGLFLVLVGIGVIVYARAVV